MRTNLLANSRMSADCKSPSPLEHSRMGYTIEPALNNILIRFLLFKTRAYRKTKTI